MVNNGNKRVQTGIEPNPFKVFELPKKPMPNAVYYVIDQVHLTANAFITSKTGIPFPITFGFVNTETDPIFTASPAFNITNLDISNWNSKGEVLSTDVSNSLIKLEDGSGNTISTIDVSFLNNEGTVLNYNTVTDEIELLNDYGVLLSSISAKLIVDSLSYGLNLTGSTLQLLDSDNVVVDSVTLTTANIQGLQAALDNKADKITTIIAGVGLTGGGTLAADRIISFDIPWGDNRYLQSFTETDPIFQASPAAGITNTNITNWNESFSWGDHSLVGYELQSNKAIDFSVLNNTLYPTTQAVADYITSQQPSSQSLIWEAVTGNLSITDGNTVNLDGRYLQTETDPIFTGSPSFGITAGDIINWNNASVDSHIQNTDQYLDFGGVNQISALSINNHIGDTSIHFTQGEIVITESQISDLQHYVHPTYAPINEIFAGAEVMASFISDGIGSVTGLTTRTLTLADLGYTGDPNASNQTLSWNPTTGVMSIYGGNSQNLDGRYALLDHTHTTSDITDLASYSDFDSYYTKTNLQTSGQASVHWNNITNTPTTLGGYGITNAYTQTQVDNLLGDYLTEIEGDNRYMTVLNEDVVSTLLNSGSDLNNIISSSNLAYTSSSANFPTVAGGQLISGFRTGGTGIHIAGSVTEEDSFFYRFLLSNSAHPWFQIASREWVNNQGFLTSETDSQTLTFSTATGDLTISNGNTVSLDNRYSLLGHTHTTADITNLAAYSGFTNYYTKTNLQTSGQSQVHWDNLTNTPSTFPSSPHTHPISDITGLQTELNSKMDRSNTITSGFGIIASPDFTTPVSIEVNTAVLDSRYLRKDINDNNGLNTLTLGEMVATTATVSTDLILSSLATSTSDTFLTYNTTTGVVEKKMFDASALFWGVANSAGVNQFDVPLESDLRFEGSGDTSVSFNPTTKTVTITSVPGSGTGGAVTSFNGRTGGVTSQAGDYSTAQVTETTNLYFTEQRVRNTVLTGLSTTTSTDIVSTDSIIQAFGKIQGQLNNTLVDTTTATVNGTAGNITVGGGATQLLSSDPTWTVNLTPTGVTIGTYPKVTVDTFGRVTVGASLVAADIPNLPASKITSGVFNTARLGTGTANSAYYLAGDSTWKQLTSINLDWGNITGTPTTLSGYGITDAYTQTQVDNLLTNYYTEAESNNNFFGGKYSAGSLTDSNNVDLSLNIPRSTSFFVNSLSTNTPNGLVGLVINTAIDNRAFTLYQGTQVEDEFYYSNVLTNTRGAWYRVASREWVNAQGFITTESDSQTLSFVDTTGLLSISGGNSVDLDGRWSLLGHTHTTADITNLSTYTGFSNYYTETEVNTLLTGYVPTTRIITAGNGLTGGGSLSTNRTITLGTPSTITLGSTNSATATTHTHAFLPGGTVSQYIDGTGSLQTFPTLQGGTVTSISTNNGITGGPITTSGTIGLTGQALALHELSTNGIIVRNGAGTVVSRSVVGGEGISVVNGNGATGNPTINLNHLGIEDLIDPAADRIMFWDDSAGSTEWLTLGNNISITGTTLNAVNTNTTYTAGTGLDLTGTQFSINSATLSKINHGETAYGYGLNDILINNNISGNILELVDASELRLTVGTTVGGWTTPALEQYNSSATGGEKFAITTFGSGDTYNYTYLGYGAYNDLNNLRLYPDGSAKIGNDEIATQLWVNSQGFLTSETDSQTLSWNSGTGALSISNGNSVDLDGRYLQSFTETDPTVPSHVKSITTGDISNWNGKAELSDINNGTLTLSTGTGLTGSDTFSANQGTNTTFTVGLSAATQNSLALANSALQVESDTLQSVANRGNTLTKSILFTNENAELKKEFGYNVGGWSRQLATFKNNLMATTNEFEIGFYGTITDYEYSYLGWGAFNAENNLRIYPDGTLRAGSSLIYNESNLTDLSQLANGPGFITSASLPTVNNAAITINPTGAITGGGVFNVNQAANESISIGFDDTGLIKDTGDQTFTGHKEMIGGGVNTSIGYTSINNISTGNYTGETWETNPITTNSVGNIGVLTGTNWEDATKNNTEMFAAGMLAISVGGGRMLLKGFYNGWSGRTQGDVVYLSNSGTVTTTKPTTVGEYVRVIGYFVNATTMYFDPDKTWVKL